MFHFSRRPRADSATLTGIPLGTFVRSEAEYRARYGLAPVPEDVEHREPVADVSVERPEERRDEREPDVGVQPAAAAQ